MLRSLLLQELVHLLVNMVMHLLRLMDLLSIMLRQFDMLIFAVGNTSGYLLMKLKLPFTELSISCALKQNVSLITASKFFMLLMHFVDVFC